MGQRLNIEIVDSSGCIANAYYHWSAYTYSAMQLVEWIMEWYFDRGIPLTVLETAVALLQVTGAGFDDYEMQYIEENYKHVFDEIGLRHSTDRNSGLLAISKKGIEDTERWEEGRVTINLDSETIDFNVVWFDDEDSYNDGQEDDLAFSKLPVMDDFSFENIPFSDFWRVREIYEEYNTGFRTSSGVAITWIG